MSSEIGAIAGLIFAFYEHQSSPITGWSFAILSIFLLFIGAFVAWKKEYEDAEKFRAGSQTKPKIVVQKNGYRCTNRLLRVGNEVRNILSLVVSFTNEAQIPMDSAVARDVIARINFFNCEVEQNPILALSTYARWASNPQPSQLLSHQTNREILATDIRIGETVELDIAVRYLDEDECFAVDNNSYYFSLKNPSLALGSLAGNLFLAKVELNGVGVKETFTFKFRNQGKWNLLEALEN